MFKAQHGLRYLERVAGTTDIEVSVRQQQPAGLVMWRRVGRRFELFDGLERIIALREIGETHQGIQFRRGFGNCECAFEGIDQA